MCRHSATSDAADQTQARAYSPAPSCKNRSIAVSESFKGATVGFRNHPYKSPVDMNVEMSEDGVQGSASRAARSSSSRGMADHASG